MFTERANVSLRMHRVRRKSRLPLATAVTRPVLTSRLASGCVASRRRTALAGSDRRWLVYHQICVQSLQCCVSSAQWVLCWLFKWRGSIKMPLCPRCKKEVYFGELMTCSGCRGCTRHSLLLAAWCYHSVPLRVCLYSLLLHGAIQELGKFIWIAWVSVIELIEVGPRQCSIYRVSEGLSDPPLVTANLPLNHIILSQGFLYWPSRISSCHLC